MDKSSKIISIILGVLIVIAIIILVINSKLEKVDNSRSVPQNISNIEHEEIDETKLSTTLKDKIKKLRGRRGNFVLEYGEQTLIMLSQGMKTAQASNIEIEHISKNNETGQYSLNINIVEEESNGFNLGSGQERYLYKIIKVDAKFDDTSEGYVTDNMGSMIRIIDAERVIQNTKNR
ncbi:MAG: hypothetical protein PHR25_06405 [Clostridia bacterium]|nr:hypothetical protein [Clostridia bacterium]MDD4376387.1 hypothetical protein [Clostridia bacterium]